MALSQERRDCMGAGALAAGVFGGAVCLAGRDGSSPGDPASGTGPVCPVGQPAVFGGLCLPGGAGVLPPQGFTTDTDTFKSWAAIANIPWGLASRSTTRTSFWTIPPGYLYVLALLDKLRLLLGPAHGELHGYTLAHQAALHPGGHGLRRRWCCTSAASDKLGERPGAVPRRGRTCSARRCTSTPPSGARRTPSARPWCWARCCCSTGSATCPAALLFGASIACKPQMLVFAPSVPLLRPQAAAGGGKLLLGIAC